MTKKEIKTRLEYLREEIEKGTISYGEVSELQNLAQYIDKGDTVLLEWAGIPEFQKAYSVSVDTTPFYVEVEAKDEDEAKQKVQELLEEGRCTNEADTVYFVVGNDIEEVK